MSLSDAEIAGHLERTASWSATARYCQDITQVGEDLSALCRDLQAARQALREITETLADEADADTPAGTARNLALIYLTGAALGEPAERAE